MFIDANRMLKLGQCDRGEMGGGGGFELNSLIFTFIGGWERLDPLITLFAWKSFSRLFYNKINFP